MKIKLCLPFKGNFPITFGFGEISADESIREKFNLWGIKGHHGIDFGLPEGIEVLACDKGKVIQVGENRDFGIRVIIKHSWGQSIYAHLKESQLTLNQKVKTGQIIGLSGKSGAAFGPHLHFGIKPNKPNLNNGFLGFVDPSPYLEY